MTHSNPENNGYLPLKILTLSSIVMFTLFVWQGNKGFSLWDEGFLWYGAQRVMLGEVPIRDFMAYDPGRYYWSGGLMSLVGDSGIMSLRATVAIFQALGLFVGLLLLASTAKNYGKDGILFLILSALTLVMWMYPRHKLFDISLSIFLLGALTSLIKSPSAKRYFIAGVCVGLIAVFGRNHGMYGLAGSLGTMAWLSIRRSPTDLGFPKGLSVWTAGVAVGFAPILLMALLVPGFAVAFWEDIRFLFEQRATNISVPVPWPWKFDFASTALGDSVREILVGFFFIGTIAFGVLSILWVVLQKLKAKPVPAALVASAFLVLPYAHFAYSRADVGHLAQGIFPLLMGCLVLLSTQSPKMKWPLALALCASSFWVMYVYQPGWQCQASKQCVSVEISGDNLQIDQGTASDIALLRQLSVQFAPDGSSLAVTNDDGSVGIWRVPD